MPEPVLYLHVWNPESEAHAWHPFVSFDGLVTIAQRFAPHCPPGCVFTISERTFP